MRSLLLFFVILIITPSALVLPHIGVLVWTWISIMSPHQLVWGFADNLPFVLMIASLTLVAWFLSSEKKLPPSQLLIWAAVALVAQATISSFVALHPTHSWPLWDRTVKTFTLFFMVAMLINSKVRIQSLLWIIAICFGFFATNGVVRTLSTGAKNVLTGPPNTMLEDNNHLALSIVMVIPIFNYLRQSSANKFVRAVLVVVMMLAIVAVLTSYSRGSLVALAAAGLFFMRFAKRGIIVFSILVVLGIMVVQLMPQKWYDRVGSMESIDSIKSDGSFSSRLDAWTASFLLAKSRPLTGGGFSAIEVPETYIRFVPDSNRGRAAHSIYFQVLGDHGFAGLIFYLLMLFAAWRHLRRTIQRHEPGKWQRQLAEMLQVSLVAFFVGGAALSVAYHDLILIILVIAMNLDILSANLSTRNLADHYVAKSAA
ncbi:MAG: putative O-glycosylation ligase, exosortase A system-associated [Gammaproteobacteria bacterium]|nr:putative O-glycosylation ligase, exosortase A system-associated [Gammaproteobacteria bacterium]